MSALKRIALTVALLLAACCPVAASDAVSCVQAFLAATALDPGPVDGAIGSRTIEAAAQFADQTGATGLPEFSEVTAPQWCDYGASEAGQDAQLVARLKVYDIAIEGELPEVDSGVGPLAFDFSKYKLSTVYEGQNCDFVINRKFSEGTQLIGSGKFTVEAGRLTITKAIWRTGGEAVSETFARANLAITKDGRLVGRMPVYHIFVPAGAVPRDAVAVTLDGTGGQLATAQPTGMVTFPIEWEFRGQFIVRTCAAPDGGLIKLAYDFSRHKLTNALDGKKCNLVIERVLIREGMQVQGIGQAVATVDRGRLTFLTGSWKTMGPSSSFKIANLAITEDWRIVGIWDVYPVFPKPREPSEQFVVELDGKGGQIGEDLAGIVEFPLESDTSGRIRVSNCRPATP
jgi:hypothetical protein